MITSRLLTAVALAVATSGTPWIVFSQTTATMTNSAVTFRYVKTGEFNDHGYLSYGTTFWATNHTGKPLQIFLSAIDVKSGSNWTTGPLQSQPLQFRVPGNPLTGLVLQPHGAGHSTVQLSGQPTTGIWRARVDVYEILSGVEGQAMHLRRYPSLVERRFQGDTNISLNPLSTKMKFTRSLGQAVSQDISED
jgi:hypothetical protein